MDANPVRPLVLHSSWRGRLLAALTPALLLSFGAIGALAVGFRVIPVVALVIGFVLLMVVVFDYPLRTVFGPESIDRKCLGRTERLAWSQVGLVGRPAYSARLGRLGRTTTGLVAAVGRRRYLLTDRMESKAEHQALLRLIAAWAEGTPVEASQPPDDWPPTWLYKRRQGSTDSLIDQA